MAKPTERRVNKAFIIPSEVEQPIVDPDLSASTDTSIDDIEALRAARYNAGLESQPQAQEVDTPPSGSDLRAGIEEAREARFADLEELHEGLDADVSDTESLNTPE